MLQLKLPLLNKCLGVLPLQASEEGAQLTFLDCTGGDNLLFSFSAHGSDGSYRMSVKHSGMCVGPTGSGHFAQWTCDKDEGQRLIQASLAGETRPLAAPVPWSAWWGSPEFDRSIERESDKLGIVKCLICTALLFRSTGDGLSSLFSLDAMLHGPPGDCTFCPC